MKSSPVILGISVTLVLLLCILSPASSMDDPGFSITRMVMCEKVIDREPVSIADTFSANMEKVFCFLEAKNIEQDTMVSFVWYHGDRELSRVDLPLIKGERWRSYASKKLAGLQGSWKVELRDASGIVRHSISFQVR